MAQIRVNLNNQMHNFYTSEIIVLPKKITSLNEEPELLVQSIKEVISDYLSKKENFDNKTNVSYFNLEYLNFPIEEIRRMQTEAEYSATFSGQGNRVFVLLNFDTASDAAANAALKIIEESPANTLILLLVSKKDKVLETIASRCHFVRLEDLEENSKTNNPVSFSWPKNYSQASELALANKDRLKASNLLEELLRIPGLEAKQKQALLQAYQDLERNQNVQLVLENCFFSLVSLES